MDVTVKNYSKVRKVLKLPVAITAQVVFGCDFQTCMAVKPPKNSLTACGSERDLDVRTNRDLNTLVNTIPHIHDFLKGEKEVCILVCPVWSLNVRPKVSRNATRKVQKPL